MINVDVTKELIDQIPDIKSLFSRDIVSLFSSYNHTTRTREHSGVEFQTIYNNPRFLQWKEKLHFELIQINDDPYVAEILKLMNHFTGWNDRSTFEKLASKLYALKDHLDEYREYDGYIQIEEDSRIPEKEICDNVLRAISKLQRNHNYDANSSEDTMNDYIRDILDERYFIKDQTRQGESENGDEAGEVDIQICHEGLPVVMIEGIKVSSLERDRLRTHINKVLTKYDPNGCPYAFLLIYTTVKNFSAGYESIFDYFNKFEYPFSRENDLQDVDTGYGELKHAHIVLNRNGTKIRVHIWTAHI